MSAVIMTEQAIGKSALNKAFWRILPLVLIAYLFAYAGTAPPRPFRLNGDQLIFGDGKASIRVLERVVH